MALKAVITVGISASGKTTWATSLDNSWVNVNRDDFRFALTGTKDWSEYKYNKATEKMVTALQEEAARQARGMGKNVVISDTNLNPATKEKWEVFLADLGYTVGVKYFPVDIKTAWKRDASRVRGVGHDVIYSQYLKYLEVTGAKKYTPNPELPSAVIFDLDGTLARMEGRGPFDWGKVHADKCRDIVLSMLHGFLECGHRIIVLTGRDGCCHEQSKQWLDDNSVYFDWFWGRVDGDCRPDTEIKEEIFWREIADCFNVIACIDDRPCMVRKWYELGVPNVISVANPYIEF